jgi:methionyl-tRNA formyltransferase
MGSPDFAVPSLEAIAARHALSLVVTQPARPAGRGRKLEPTAVQRAAGERGLEVFTYEHGRRAELDARLAALTPDLLVVVAFGHILRPSTLGLARYGALNVHASLLPRWRGVAPIERAILAGDTLSGVSIMQIDAGVDTGPLLVQVSEPILPADTRVSLAARLAALGARTLAAAADDFLAGRLVPVPQPEAGACYAPRLEKQEGEIDWAAEAATIVNRVRGLYEWPGAFTFVAGHLLKVHRAHAERETASAPAGTVLGADVQGGLRVACGRGEVSLAEVQLAGKTRVEAAALLRGRVLQPGMRLGR